MTDIKKHTSTHRSWIVAYIAVVVWLALLIVFFYFFTKYYS